VVWSGEMPVRYSGFRQWLALVGAGLALLTACGGDSEVVPVGPPPTRTLIPPTLTPTAVPGDLTPTPTDLPAPSALLLPAATVVPQVPPVAQALVDRTARDLVEQHGVAPESIRLLSVDAVTWHGGLQSCETPSGGNGTETPTTPGYRIAFTASSRVYVYRTDDQGTFFLCPDRTWLAQEGDPVIVDPIAQSMVDLTRQDAARRLKAPEAEIKLVSLLTVNWPDSSLGCPKAGADYEDREMSGYRIVFQAADQMIIYHSSIRDFVRCAPEEEILPGILRQAMATPEPSSTP
jgi:hypothetical protein